MVRLYTDIFKVFSGLSSNNKNTNKIVNSIFILPDILISVDRTLTAGLQTKFWGFIIKWNKLQGVWEVIIEKMSNKKTKEKY